MKNFFVSLGSKIKNFFSSLSDTKFFSRFKGLNTLVVIQLKDKLNMSFKADKKGSLIKLAIRLILFVVVTVAITLVFSLMGKLFVFGPGADSCPVPIFNFFFITMLLLSTITCIGSLTKSLYFSRDNLTLLSYPVRANTVFLSKLIVYYIISLIREVTFILPLFLAYGISYGLPVYYFFWVIFMYFVVCAIPVAIASIVSIPWMVISMYFRKHPLSQDIVTVLLLIAISVLLFIGIDKIPSDLHFFTKWGEIYYPQFLTFTKNFQHWFAPFFYVSALVLGCDFNSMSAKSLTIFNAQTGPLFAIVVGSVVVMILLAYLFAKPLFFKMAAKPFEFSKKVIFHNYNEPKGKLKSSFYENAFVPVEFEGKKISRKDRVSLNAKLEKVLNNLVLEEKIFGKSVSEKRILRLLKSYSGMEFTVVPVDVFIENKRVGFMVEYHHDVPELVLTKSIGINSVNYYNPLYLASENHPKTAFFSMMWKDILMAIRTPGTLMADYLLMIIGPLSIAFMNKLFQSINTSFMGDQLVAMFNILMIVMIPLVSSVSMASIYSREGESSYLLKASPSNYAKTLTSKLVLRWMMVALSLVGTVIVYNHYCSLFFNKPAFLYFAILFVYTGHLIWSAELDYMNPQDQLYKEVGEGNISNNNENVSGILAFVITALFTFISYFFLKEDVMVAFYKMFIIALIFLACRILLAVLKIKGYKTSRGERGRD